MVPATSWARGSQALTFWGRRGLLRPALAHQQPRKERPFTAPWLPPVSSGARHHGTEAPPLLGGFLLRIPKAGPRGACHLQQRHHPSPPWHPAGSPQSSGPWRVPTYRIGAEGLPLGAQKVGEIAVFAELHDHHEGPWGGAGQELVSNGYKQVLGNTNILEMMAMFKLLRACS